MVAQEQTRAFGAPTTTHSRRSPWKRRKFLIGGLVLVLAFGLLIYQGIASSGMYYLTVQEYRALDAQAAAQQVRIGGKVEEGSVNWEPKTMTLRFVVADDAPEGSKMAVLYRGVVPDSFKPGAEVVLEGKASPAGDLFEAKTLLTKCASKYLPI